MKQKGSGGKLPQLILSAVFTALICAGSYIAVPLIISPVPIVLQNMFVLLAGLLLGPLWGFVSVATFLLLGILGFPVFSLGRGGIVHFLGPTGGYLLGYIPAVWAGGTLAAVSGNKKWGYAAAAGASLLMIYAAGVPWLKTVLDLPWKEALVLGMIPFVPGDILKAAAAVLLACSAEPLVRGVIRSPGGYRKASCE